MNCPGCLKPYSHAWDVFEGVPIMTCQGPYRRYCSPCLEHDGWKRRACTSWEDGKHLFEAGRSTDPAAPHASATVKTCACGASVLRTM